MLLYNFSYVMKTPGPSWLDNTPFMVILTFIFEIVSKIIIIPQKLHNMVERLCLKLHSLTEITVPHSNPSTLLLASQLLSVIISWHTLE